MIFDFGHLDNQGLENGYISLKALSKIALVVERTEWDPSIIKLTPAEKSSKISYNEKKGLFSSIKEARDKKREAAELEKRKEKLKEYLEKIPYSSQTGYDAHKINFYVGLSAKGIEMLKNDPSFTLEIFPCIDVMAINSVIMANPRTFAYLPQNSYDPDDLFCSVIHNNDVDLLNAHILMGPACCLNAKNPDIINKLFEAFEEHLSMINTTDEISRDLIYTLKELGPDYNFDYSREDISKKMMLASAVCSTFNIAKEIERNFNDSWSYFPTLVKRYTIKQENFINGTGAEPIEEKQQLIALKTLSPQIANKIDDIIGIKIKNDDFGGESVNNLFS